MLSFPILHIQTYLSQTIVKLSLRCQKPTAFATEPYVFKGLSRSGGLGCDSSNPLSVYQLFQFPVLGKILLKTQPL